MSDPIRMPASYDAWKTQGPPDPEVCPKCGDYIDDAGKCEDESCDFQYIEPDYDDRED